MAKRNPQPKKKLKRLLLLLLWFVLFLISFYMKWSIIGIICIATIFLYFGFFFSTSKNRPKGKGNSGNHVSVRGTNHFL